MVGMLAASEPGDRLEEADALVATIMAARFKVDDAEVQMTGHVLPFR